MDKPELEKQTAAIEPKHLQRIVAAVEAAKTAEAQVSRLEQFLANARAAYGNADGKREGTIETIGSLYGFADGPLSVDLKAATITGMREKTPAAPLAVVPPAG